MQRVPVRHAMTADSAADLLDALQRAGVDACVGGGWAVDALLREQSRDHSDLDLWVDAAHFDRLIPVMSERRLDRLLVNGGDRPWNFVLHDGGSLRVDLHLYEMLPGTSDLHYGSASTGVRFAGAALTGEGLIGGRIVRCDTPEWSRNCHTSYPARDVDLHDMTLLCAAFGLTPLDPIDPG